jgi:hypothetical protein
VDAAAQMETFKTSFEVLLGSAEKAGSRMKELLNFANNTPYELKDVAAASLKLEVLTKGALSTGKGLEMVGNIASGTNRNFEDTAVTVAHLFNALRNGQGAGDALRSLQDSGAITASAARQIGATAAIDNVAAWKMAQQELSRFDGMMSKKAGTWDGLMSTFRQSINNAMTAWGEPLIAQLKPVLEFATKVIFALAPQIAKAGAIFAAGVKTGVDFLVGALSNPTALILPIQLGLEAAFLGACNVLIAGVEAATTLLTSPTAWTALAGAGMILQGSLIKAFTYALSFLQAGFEQLTESLPEALGGKKGGSDESKRNKLALERDQIEYKLRGREAATVFTGQGGTINIPGVAPATGKEKDALHARLLENMKEAAALKDETLGQRAERIRKNDVFGISEAADNKTTEGEKTLGSTAPAMAKVLMGGIKIKDVMGAGAAMSKAMAAAAPLVTTGQEIEKSTPGERDAEKKPEEKRKFNYDRFKNFDASGTFGSHLEGFGLQGTGLRGASMATGFKMNQIGPWAGGYVMPGMSGALGAEHHDMQTAYSQTNLLGAKERRSAEAAKYAAIAGETWAKTGKFTSARPDGAVRRGDRVAAKAAAQERLREKTGLDKSNSLLSNLNTKMDQAWLTPK